MTRRATNRLIHDYLYVRYLAHKIVSYFQENVTLNGDGSSYYYINNVSTLAATGILENTT